MWPFMMSVMTSNPSSLHHHSQAHSTITGTYYTGLLQGVPCSSQPPTWPGQGQAMGQVCGGASWPRWKTTGLVGANHAPLGRIIGHWIKSGIWTNDTNHVYSVNDGNCWSMGRVQCSRTHSSCVSYNQTHTSG